MYINEQVLFKLQIVSIDKYLSNFPNIANTEPAQRTSKNLSFFQFFFFSGNIRAFNIYMTKQFSLIIL